MLFRNPHTLALIVLPWHSAARECVRPASRQLTRASPRLLLRLLPDPQDDRPSKVARTLDFEDLEVGTGVFAMPQAAAPFPETLPFGDSSPQVSMVSENPGFLPDSPVCFWRLAHSVLKSCIPQYASAPLHFCGTSRQIWFFLVR